MTAFAFVFEAIKGANATISEAEWCLCFLKKIRKITWRDESSKNWGTAKELLHMKEAFSLLNKKAGRIKSAKDSRFCRQDGWVC